MAAVLFACMRSPISVARYTACVRNAAPFVYWSEEDCTPAEASSHIVSRNSVIRISSIEKPRCVCTRAGSWFRLVLISAPCCDRDVAGGRDGLDIRFGTRPGAAGREGQAARAGCALRAVCVEAGDGRRAGHGERRFERAVLADRVRV